MSDQFVPITLNPQLYTDSYLDLTYGTLTEFNKAESKLVDYRVAARMLLHKDVYVLGMAPAGGGGTVDAEARAAIATFYKKGGDTLKAEEEVFVLMADGIPVNWKNPNKKGGKALKVPDAPTADNMLAAGFERLGGDVEGQAVIKAWKTERTAWTVDDMVDFTVAEPPLANVGKRYLSTKTGKGSASTNLDFHDGDLYEVTPDGKWAEYEPKDSWTLTHEEHFWVWFNGKWNSIPGIAHSHDRLAFGDYTFFIDDKGNWVKKKKSAAQANTVTPQARQMATLDGVQAAQPAAAVAVPQDEETILKFSGGLKRWEAGQAIEEGYLRSAALMAEGDTAPNAILVANLDRTTGQAFDADELTGDASDKNNFDLVSQSEVLEWLRGRLAIKGLWLKYSGFLGQYNATGLTGDGFDYAEQARFSFQATAATGLGTVVYKPGHGLEVGQIVKLDLSLCQPNERPCGYVRVVDGDSVVIDGNGWGIDPNNTDIDAFWDNDPGTELFVGVDGTFTPDKPTTYPYTSMGRVWDSGYFLCEIQHVEAAPLTITPEIKNLYYGIDPPTDDLGTAGDYYKQSVKPGEFSVWGPKTDKWPATAQQEKMPDFEPRIAKLETDGATHQEVRDKVRQAVQVTYTDSIPVPYWPPGAPLNTQGSPWVRQGEVSTVTETTVINNGFAGSHQFAQSFGISDRGKSLIYRVALPVTETNRRLICAFQNSAGGLIANFEMSHDGTSWVCAAGTIINHNGYAILSVPVTLSASLNSSLNAWVTPGRWQAPCFYEPGKDQFVRTETGLQFEDIATGSKRNISDTVMGLSPRVIALENKDVEQTTKISVIEGKLSNLAPILVLNAISKSNSTLLVAPDRNGASFSNLSFVFRDGRTIAVNDAKLSYPARQATVSIPVSAFKAETLSGWTYDAAMNPEGLLDTPLRKTFWRSYTFEKVIYRCYVQWERTTSEWRFWFIGWHSASWSLTALADVKADYALDDLSADASFSAFAKKVDLGEYLKTKDLPEEIEQGQALPGTSTAKLFILSGHASLPDGVYRFDQVWVQL